MITKISMKNFMSIKNRQEFSFYSEDLNGYLKKNVCYPNNDKENGVLKSLILFGANNSGKSNILSAFLALRYLISSSNSLEEDKCIPCYKPFLLSDDTKFSSVNLEIEFFIDNILYAYKISFLSKNIKNESLSLYLSNKEECEVSIFNRKEVNGVETIEFGDSYKFLENRYSFNKNRTCFSVIYNNSDCPVIFSNIFNFFDKLILFNPGDKLSYNDEVINIKAIELFQLFGFSSLAITILG